ncbi:histone-lysine N-methyltransferase SETMAR [Trichonephila clavipes]|nr:histone-lysine N-methyltransferase SETMAR [Trichonephila clavipes]
MTHMEQSMAVRLEHLVHYHEDGNDILLWIVKRDESWVHHFIPEAKVTSMARKNSASSVRKKFKTTNSVGKMLLSVFRDAQRGLLLNFLEVGTINATRLCDTLSKLKGANT